MTIFAVVYIGVEVTLGGLFNFFVGFFPSTVAGWIVTFVIRERHGGRNTGYISSGFFGGASLFGSFWIKLQPAPGLTLGRVSLMWFNKIVGEYRVIFVYSLIAIG